jgi:hypothetical protein
MELSPIRGVSHVLEHRNKFGNKEKIIFDADTAHLKFEPVRSNGQDVAVANDTIWQLPQEVNI